MSKLLSACAIAGLACAMVSAQGQTPEPQYSATLKVGDPAPEFSLPGSDGKTHKLSDYRGRPLCWRGSPTAFTGG